jgi:hypothetical protein
MVPMVALFKQHANSDGAKLVVGMHTFKRYRGGWQVSANTCTAPCTYTLAAVLSLKLAQWACQVEKC